MAETPNETPLHVRQNQEALRKIGRDLAAAFDTLTAEFRAGQKRREEALEVAALFELHRQYRFRPTGAPPRAETLSQLSAAIRGYGTEYLHELATFGGYLADAASKEYGSR